MADEAGTQDGAQSTQLHREAEIASELEQALRAEGSAQLIAAVARLTAKSEQMDQALTEAEGRVAVLEAAVDALQIPMLRGLTEGLELPSSITISADLPLGARDGFHRVEYPAVGDPYRWTGANGSDFRFVFLVDRSKPLVARLALGRRGPGMQSEPTSIDCLVDGQHAPAEVTDKAGSIYAVPLPVRHGGGLTQIVFTTATGPAGGESDKRELGVPFRYLSVGPDGDD